MSESGIHRIFYQRSLPIANRSILQVGYVMRDFRPISLVEQVAEHLRREILHGTLTRTAPGVHRLAADMGVHHTTAEAALKQLEQEGLLVSQGAGKRRKIQSTEKLAPPSLRIAILTYEDTDCTLHFVLEMQHKLQDAGHSVGFADKNLRDLGMDAKRVAKFVGSCDVDAWIVVAGPREVLEWFANQPKPAFSVFGRRRNIPIASIGPDKLPALLDSLDRLVELGHSRIVMLFREEHRKPPAGIRCPGHARCHGGAWFENEFLQLAGLEGQRRRFPPLSGFVVSCHTADRADHR